MLKPHRPRCSCGAWRAEIAADSAYISETFVDSGAHFIALDFTSVIEVNGNLMTLADQVRRAVAWVHQNAASFGGNPNRLYVSGVSSGGHLAGVVLTTDWQKDFGLPVATVKGGLCGSGLFELHPVALSKRGDYVKFTNDVVQALSPQRHLEKLVAPVIIAHGTLETPEFQRQSREFAAAAKAAGKSVTFLVGEGYNTSSSMKRLATRMGCLGARRWSRCTSRRSKVANAVVRCLSSEGGFSLNVGQPHAREAVAKARVASQAVPLRSDSEVHQRRVAAVERAIEVSERCVEVAYFS